MDSVSGFGEQMQQTSSQMGQQGCMMSDDDPDDKVKTK